MVCKINFVNGVANKNSRVKQLSNSFANCATNLRGNYDKGTVMRSKKQRGTQADT